MSKSSREADVGNESLELKSLHPSRAEERRAGQLLIQKFYLIGQITYQFRYLDFYFVS